MFQNFFPVELLPQGYTVYREDRDFGGGGVFLALSCGLASVRVPSPPGVECVIVRVFSSKPFLLCVVYVPPNCQDSYLSPLLSLLFSLSQTEEILLLGDFNLPDICWDSMSAVSSLSTSLCDFAVGCGLQQMVAGPTHEKGNTLDLVLSTFPDSIQSLSVHSDRSHPDLLSDHFPITFDLNHSFSQGIDPSPPPTYQFSKRDYDGLSDYLLSYDFSFFFRSQDIEFLWKSLKSIILDGCDWFIPVAPGPSSLSGSLVPSDTNYI